MPTDQTEGDTGRAGWRVLGDPLLPPTGPGPLTGELVAVKDVFAVAGQRIGAGVPAYLDEEPVQEVNAWAVQRLLDAGAAVQGVAHTDQFAYSLAGDNPHYPTPVNAAVPGALPGGSSSGPATTVALGSATIGLGTDTAGSIRVPASYQGLWGIRTTQGAVPSEGLVPLAPEFDTVGVLTRDAALLRRATEVLVGPDGATVDGTRLLVPRLLEVPAPVSRAWEEWLSSVSLPVHPVDLPGLPEAAEAFRVHQAWQAWQVHGRWLEEHPGAVQGPVAQRFAVAARVGEAEDRQARADLDRLRRQLDDLLADGVLVLPSAASAAPPLDAPPHEVEVARTQTFRLTCTAGVTGRPAVAAPLLRTPDGPVGVSLVGPRGADRALVALAAQLG